MTEGARYVVVVVVTEGAREIARAMEIEGVTEVEVVVIVLSHGVVNLIIVSNLTEHPLCSWQSQLKNNL